jgi:hypothetical protein
MIEEFEFTTGTVTVPRGVWPDVLSYAARRTAEYLGGWPEPGRPDPRPGENGAAPDLGKIVELLEVGNVRARTIYRLLAEQGSVLIDTLSSQLGLKASQTPGVLGAMGRSLRTRGLRTANCSRTPEQWWGGTPEPWESTEAPADVIWGWDADERTLTMPASIAKLFKQALVRMDAAEIESN